MRPIKEKIKTSVQCFTSIFLGIASICFTKPANALVPYIFEPSQNELKKTSYEIGRTAAQLLQLGQAEEAARLAALAVSVKPDDDKLWSILAEAQLRNNWLKKAKFSLEKAKELNPKNPQLWFADASLELQQKNSKKAIELAEKGLKLDPKNPIAFFYIGNARIMQNDYSLAIKAFDKAFKLKPSFWEANNNKAIVLFEMDKTQEAIKTWREVLRIKINAEPMLALAAGLNKNKPGDAEALELASKALAKNPNYVSVGHQKEQLWGMKLRKATALLLNHPELEKAVAQAEATSQNN